MYPGSFKNLILYFLNEFFFQAQLMRMLRMLRFFLLIVSIFMRQNTKSRYWSKSIILSF